jgi:hypothetical protein
VSPSDSTVAGVTVAHASPHQRTSELLLRGAVARKCKTMLGTVGADYLACDDLEVVLRPPMAAAHVAPTSPTITAGVTASASSVGAPAGANFATVFPTRMVRFRTVPAFAAPPIGRSSDNRSATRANGASTANFAVIYASSGAMPAVAANAEKLFGSWIPARQRQGAQPTDPHRDVAEHRAEGGGVVALTHELRPAALTPPEPLAHRGNLSANDLRLSGCRQPFALVQR